MLVSLIYSEKNKTHIRGVLRFNSIPIILLTCDDDGGLELNAKHTVVLLQGGLMYQWVFNVVE